MIGCSTRCHHMPLYGRVSLHQMAEGAIKLDQPSVNICQDTKTICVWRHCHATYFPLYQILNLVLLKLRKIETGTLVPVNISRRGTEPRNLKKMN